MPAHQLLELLHQRRVPYAIIRRPPAVPVPESAASAPLPGQALAQTIPVKLDGQLALAVLPASDRLDIERLKAAAGVGHVEFASEQEVHARLPGCQVGALPPFGQLYGLAVWVAERLAAGEEIAFAAGTSTELIRMGYKDFERVLVMPRVVDFSSA